MKKYIVIDAALLLLMAMQPPAPEAASVERKWSLGHESLSDYGAVRSLSAESEIECSAAASGSTVQLVAFNASSGLCDHFRCRLGLSHCRKCRNANKGAQPVWTASSDCWTTVQHRVSSSVDFDRNWTQYQSEFGEGPDGNYWIGLNALNELTFPVNRKLRILMKTWNDSVSWAEYSSFSVGPESDHYRLSVSGFSGSAGIGDSLTRNSGLRFSARDADRDVYVHNCAAQFHGAWWYSNCSHTYPNGVFRQFPGAVEIPFCQGIIWRFPYGSHYSLKEFEMLVL